MGIHNSCKWIDTAYKNAYSVKCHLLRIFCSIYNKFKLDLHSFTKIGGLCFWTNWSKWPVLRNRECRSMLKLYVERLGCLESSECSYDRGDRVLRSSSFRAQLDKDTKSTPRGALVGESCPSWRFGALYRKPRWLWPGCLMISNQTGKI